MRGIVGFSLFFGIVSVILLFVFKSAEWRSDTVSLPRYCDDPSYHVGLVREILSEEDPAGEENRRPYIIAAKLIYLVPQNVDERLKSYLVRLEHVIREVC
jgi:hypothetical protein